MSAVAFIRRCLAVGMDLDLALTAAEAFEAEVALIPPPMSKGAIRQARYRERQASQSVTSDGSDAERNAPHVGERAQVVTPSLPSLRSEELEEPISSDEDIRPLKPKAAKPNGFARFWEAYPNKTAKLVAEKAYAKALRGIPGPDPPGVILAGIERAKLSRKWVDGYIPNPATWLRGGCWEDHPSEVIPLNGKPHERPHHPAPSTAREDRLGRMLRGAMAAVDKREPVVGGRDP